MNDIRSSNYKDKAFRANEGNAEIGDQDCRGYALMTRSANIVIHRLGLPACSMSKYTLPA
jgi:hypothetical protein